MTIDPWILAFSALTVIATIWVGFWSARRSKTAHDFYVAGRSVSVGWNASAISGEYLSAASFMGVAGMVMSSGYDALWYPVCYACGYLFLLLFIAGPLRRFGAYTIPDFAEGRFDSPVFRKIAVVFVLFIGFFYTMPQMKGAGTTLAYIFPGLPYWAGVVLVGAVITLNVALGGMKGITLVQAFQYWAKMFAISVPIFVLMAVCGHYGKQLGANGNIQPPTFNIQLSTNPNPVVTTVQVNIAGRPDEMIATNGYIFIKGKADNDMRAFETGLKTGAANFAKELADDVAWKIKGGFETTNQMFTRGVEFSPTYIFSAARELSSFANGRPVLVSDKLDFLTNYGTMSITYTSSVDRVSRTERWLADRGVAVVRGKNEFMLVPVSEKSPTEVRLKVESSKLTVKLGANAREIGTEAGVHSGTANDLLPNGNGPNQTFTNIQVLKRQTQPRGPNNSRGIIDSARLTMMEWEFKLGTGWIGLTPNPIASEVDGALEIYSRFKYGYAREFTLISFENSHTNPVPLTSPVRTNATMPVVWLLMQSDLAARGIRLIELEPRTYAVYPTNLAVQVSSVLEAYRSSKVSRQPLPEKAPADSTWLSPLGPLTTKAAKAAGISGEAATPYSLLYTYSLIIALVCGTAGLPHILVRFYTNPDGVAAKRTTMWVMILIGIFYVFPPVFGVMGRNLLPDLYAGVGAKGTDKIVLELPRILNQRYAPLGSILSGITCAGAFAAFMSTFSGLLVSMTGALAHDVYGRMFRPKSTPEQRLRAFKICTVLIGGIAIVLGCFVEPLEINFMVGQAFAIAAASYFPLLFMSVWWRGMTMSGAATGMLTGGLCALAAVTLTNFSNLALDKGPMGKFFAGFAPLNPFWAAHPLLRILCEQPAIWTVPLAIALMIVIGKLTGRAVPPDTRMKMLVLHAPEKLGLKQEYIQEHQHGH